MNNDVIFNELDYKITEKEIVNAIARLKSGKARGLDLISNEMLKHSQSFLIPCIYKFFNMCYTFGVYPQAWANGYIIPIFKSDDPNNPSNYRGITITSALGKLFNSILNCRLEKFLHDHDLIHHSQMGFTKAARTSDHLFVLKCLIDKYCNSKEGRLYACFIDFHKAFDSVIHTGLKLKLLHMNVGSKFYNIISNMYKNSQACVKTGHLLTNSFPITLGVRQGDNLSPSLFKIFINDFPAYLEKCRDAVSLHTQSVNCLMYADDIVIFSSTAEGLQARLAKLERYCSDWCLTVNLKKTKVLIFNKAGRNIQQKFLFQNRVIDSVSNYKYLGVLLATSGSFQAAKYELCKKASKAYYKLRNDFISLNPGIKTSVHVFDSTIKPILLYNAEIWGVSNIFSTRLSKIENLRIDDCFKNLLSERIYVKFCKYILGVHKKSTNFAVLSELGRFPLHYDIVKSLIRYWYRLENLSTEFTLLKDAYECSKKLF